MPSLVATRRHALQRLTQVGNDTQVQRLRYYVSGGFDAAVGYARQQRTLVRLLGCPA